MVFEKQCDRTPLMTWRELFTRASSADVARVNNPDPRIRRRKHSFDQ